ncbi:VanW family protein [Candidatus Daviesbacteria bacterium]|nr:VanW family protein [Candidatus Daviesbacteria bacterium]
MSQKSYLNNLLFKPIKLGNILLWFKKNYLPALLFLTLVILSFITFQAIFENKFFPRTYIGDANLTFLTKPQVLQNIQNKFTERSLNKLQFLSQDKVYGIDLIKINPTIDYSIVDQAFFPGHQNSFFEKLSDQVKILFFSKQFEPRIEFNIEKQTDEIAKAVLQPPLEAQLTFNETVTAEGSPAADVQIKESLPGIELDKKQFQEEIRNYLIYGSYHKLLPLKVSQPKITTSYLQKAKLALENTQKDPIKIIYEGNIWILDSKQLLPLLDLTEGTGLLDEGKTKIYLGKIAQEIDREVREGRFEFNQQTQRVTTFQPSEEGKKTDIDKGFEIIFKALEESGTKEIKLPVEVVKPKVNAAEINNLGIKELIGRGISNFAGSIQNRIYNISLTAAKLNGTLVPPGEVFSFNKTVGDISAATGFKQAYVIKEGRTVLDDGGGVCQDSTTLFRAVLNAGLPVVKRTAHAYRVSYYEQGFAPGLDATVYYPSVDFQFKNDTQAHILVQAYTQGTTLYMDLYGTHDGRVVSLTNPVISSQTPPPPEIRQDDPTLPKGQIKQVDWAAWGANVSFKRIVTREEETLIDEAWRSNYRPWQAVYLVGTKEN